jgi:hypothetical protein
LLRQSVFGRLAGYEDVNDAERLCRDPAMRWVVEGKATSFIRDEAGTHRFRCPQHPSRLGLFAMDAQKPDNGARLSCNPRKNILLSVNYLTLLNRFLNDAAGGWADRDAHLANAG